MPERRLPFTALTSDGRAYDIEFPLHPETRAPGQVGEMLSAVLAALSEVIDREGDVSDGDVLQALAMAVAVRARTVDAPIRTSGRLVAGLLEGALDAVESAPAGRAGRA